MPTYDYKCDKCGAVRTQTIGLADVDTFRAVCAEGDLMRRVLSPTPVTFKGSGFYTTDKNKR
jgi:putative FmdB family regulatory protein